MLSEEALGQFPVFGELAGAFHQGVDPAYPEGCSGVFESFACNRVVFHDLAGADAALCIDLEVDDIS